MYLPPLRRQVTVVFVTSEHPTAQPVLYCRNFIQEDSFLGSNGFNGHLLGLLKDQLDP